ncbi:MAG: type III-A CRISPR-associated protein Csm2 [Synergistetes bacterium]|nr:type III-A CRISPR-associated protein Csm2 [Synergistota bacterium]MCX8127332.1 type III-A CRISPR-associated protein Csm2 [Synergistota bacterium]MDW8192196.1 type III-A CRISPR-associated protein Csm2 [Synergistota bacterium]
MVKNEQAREGQNTKYDSAFIEKNAIKINEIKNVEELNRLCEEIEKLAKSDKTTFTQIRNIYSRVRKVKELKDLVALRPVLAYVGARNNIKDLTGLLDRIIKAANKSEHLDSFKKFMEMLVCYKRVHKGQEAS